MLRLICISQHQSDHHPELTTFNECVARSIMNVSPKKDTNGKQKSSTNLNVFIIIRNRYKNKHSPKKNVIKKYFHLFSDVVEQEPIYTSNILQVESQFLAYMIFVYVDLFLKWF